MANTEKNEKYITELAGPDDRWLSVTDAARITRRQEKSIRDWVESGKLPVNPERTGLNKRTRLVRLSDLATLTPIVDPDAGISTDVGLLDLPSIPKAQQRLTEQMTALQQDVTTLASQQKEFAQETRQVWGVHQEQYRALDQRDGELLQAIQQAREDWTANLQEAARYLHTELEAQSALQELALTQVRSELLGELAQDNKALRLWVLEQIGKSEAGLRESVAALSTRLGETEQALRIEQTEAVERLKKSISALGTHLVESLQGEHDRTSEALQARQVAHDQLRAQSDDRYTETHRQLTQLQGTQAEQDAATSRRLTELTENAAALDKRVAGQATELSQLATTWQLRAEEAEREARQLRTDLNGQVKNQQALQKQLDEERKAREALAKQVELLLKQDERKGKKSS